MAGVGNAPAASGSNPFQTFMQPYMNNPYRMNMQKCMDNDACTAWVTHQMYQGFTGTGGSSQPSTGDNTGSTDASGSGSGDSNTGSSGDSNTGGASGSGSSGTGSTNVYSPAMAGFPPGFNPAVFGLDWDARPVDCMDDSKCARGLMMFTSGRSMGGAIGGAFAQMFMPSRLQRPRLLS